MMKRSRDDQNVFDWVQVRLPRRGGNDIRIFSWGTGYGIELYCILYGHQSDRYPGENTNIITYQVPYLYQTVHST